jgi:Ca2+-binding RTX toxin-like protein
VTVVSGLLRCLASLAIVVLAASVAPASVLAVSGTDTLSTIAGTSPGYSGDGGQATSARLDGPWGVAVDAAGSVYVADENNHRIRKISPAGVITTVAGTGVSGYSGEGGQATSAQLNHPLDVEVDASGNVFVADFLNHRVRRISTAGIITTVAGTVNGYAGDGGPATAARLSFPRGIALDADGNLLIADSGNARIRRVDSNATITTVAGSGLTGLSGDGGMAGAAELSDPYDVATDKAGNFYVADLGNHKVRKVDADGVITTLAGTGVAGFSGDGQAVTTSLNGPVRVAADTAGNVYVADSNNLRIRKVTPGGIMVTIAGTDVGGNSGDGGQAMAAQLNTPTGLEVRADGSLVFADFWNGRVRVIRNAPPSAAFGTALRVGELWLPVAFDASGSSDSNGSIASYEWEFGDGQNGTGQRVGHTYPNVGTFLATLTVTDELGATASTTRRVNINAAPSPVPVPAPAQQAPPAAPSPTASCGRRAATIVGSAGSDVLVGTAGVDVIAGLGGDDVLRGRGGNDILCGGRGNDRLGGGPGHDRLYGGEGSDQLSGEAGSDQLSGGAGSDWLGGGAGSDRLSGGAGSDWLGGGAGSDWLSGGAGSDWLGGGAGSDRLSGGRGHDRLDRAAGRRA